MQDSACSSFFSTGHEISRVESELSLVLLSVCVGSQRHRLCVTPFRTRIISPASISVKR
jgi:hypothetical protein